MHIWQAALPLSLISSVPTAFAAPNNDPVIDQLRRAAPDSPSGGYAPASVTCPAEKPTIRDASSLSPSELQWLEKRRANTIDPMIKLFKQANIPDFDAVSYIQSSATNFSVVPNIGISMSGGGYRALMNGAGFLAAADARTPGSTDRGGIGNLLQASTYLSGLSGGGWLVGSMFANNFSSITTLRDGQPGSSLWQFGDSIFTGPKKSGLKTVNTLNYWLSIIATVQQKLFAGYPVTVTDYWGRALSYQLINAKDGGPSYTFSSIAEADHFVAADTPMPILVADERKRATTIISLDSTVVEFNPWEFGTFDPTIYAFAPTKYIGSDFNNGAVQGSDCVRGYDQYGFIMGTSSSLFNELLLQNLGLLPDVIRTVLRNLLSVLNGETDVAQWRPNPFYKYHSDTNPNANAPMLRLVDGGEDLQNVPLHPLLHPVRAVDVIFAVDSSADTKYNYPNGTALRATYTRSQNPISNGTQFPAIPNAETFINLGLNQRPTFFGCDTTEFTAGKTDAHIPPLIVYVPLSPYSAYSNASTFDPTYTNDERNAFIQNGLNVATMGNGTLDSEWTSCLTCAVLSRSLERTGTPIPSTCNSCFARYCWNGATDSTPVANYEPHLVL
ncbi:lysophospholipase [Xylaria nigripes]|nr:lysophospholipase [Xylaria nigripes]